MFLLDNPVLQRELLVNLRMHRAFALLFAYLAVLGAVVLLAWPDQRQVDMSSSAEAKELVNFFFAGQFFLASLMAPSFAAGTITGEKERKTYESLLASPLRPSAIVLGKLLASLCHLGILILCSLPIVMLCVPLGGVSLYEVLAAYLAMFVSITCFTMISIACSSFFQRTVAALTVSYLIILPMAMVGALLWWSLESAGALRLMLVVTVWPLAGLALFLIVFYRTTRRLLYPADLGSEGKEVVDLDHEMDKAVGMVIQSDRFPDRLFAPAKRNTLIPDGANPVYDKEMRSELFSQGTLMLRIVIQVSMLLAIPLMAFFFYIFPALAPWYICYVLLFNMLIGPVFSADRITSERERETLDLLLTTTISPWHILWGKLISGLRVSTVLTFFLVWPVALACLMVPDYWQNLPVMAAYVVVIALACVTTSTVALFCSVVFRQTAISLMCSYVILLILFMFPPAVTYLVDRVAQRQTSSLVSTEDKAIDESEAIDHGEDTGLTEIVTEPAALSASPSIPTEESKAAPVRAERIASVVRWASFTSPFSAVLGLPPTITRHADYRQESPVLPRANWWLLLRHVGFTFALNVALMGAITWLFNVRWRVAQ